MQKTLELLDQALQIKRAAQWCNDLNLDPSTMSQAKKRGRLSPTLAGNLAIELGADPEHWIAVAALEAEPQSDLLASLKKKAESWRKR